MSFLHSHTDPCLKSELDLFSVPLTQTALEANRWVHYKPVSSLSDESPIEFVISSQNEDYIDLAHTMLRVNVKLTPYDKDGDALVAPVNNFLHSIFNQVDVYFNQKLVTPPNNAYPYRAYIETLLNYGPAAKSSHLSTNLWETDVAGEMDELPGAKKKVSSY
ncbi:uncharacterized protein F54H12.2-like [Copidosoma floridanum]|uniref:uncharacterized protein F54H12.2-like n=1 Tax=Copidosoma floridanum TaxID=29053 RepID=UPI0006C9A4A6|nr:uncharacterized protein F54H12.2-like [Copidosoma floridanum]